MKIMIMDYSSKSLWYSNKIGKTYRVTKDGEVSKKDAEVIER
ncbi:hypothetical protein [Clostridium carboxidivorans]|nr:hypothetical protein [Clostridium carboxidivorans]